MAKCDHLGGINEFPGKQRVCEDCVKIGGQWVHLRLCLECGHVGCCDSSPNRHATKHYHQTHHAVMRSYEPGEDWGWCFVDEVEIDFTRGVKHPVILG